MYDLRQMPHGAFPCKGCASSLHSMHTTVYRGKLKHLQTGGRRSRTEAGTDTRTSMYTCACARFLFNSTWLLMGKAEEQGAQRVWNSKAQGTRGGASARPSFRLGPTPGAKPSGPSPAHLKGAGDRDNSEELQAVYFWKYHAE